MSTTNDEWIRDRTGIEARHFADDGVQTSDLGVEAARGALAIGRHPGRAARHDRVRQRHAATRRSPPPRCGCRQKLGVNCPSFDVNAACAGFSYGLAAATAFIQAGMADTILLIGAEIFSRIIDFTDRGTCILFGDGAGAAVVQASDAPGIEGTVLGADGTRRGDPAGCPAAARATPASRDTVAAQRPLRPDAERPRGLQAGRDGDGRGLPRAAREVGPHDRRRRRADPPPGERAHHEAVVDRLGIDPAKAVVDVAEVGNTSAASIPIALDRAWRAGRIARGRPGAVHVVRRRAHVGRHPRAVDDAGAHLVTSKVAVVTGASRGIGRACAVALAEAGWTVAVGYRSDETAAKDAARPPRGRRHAGPRRLPRRDRRGERAGGVPSGGRRGRERHRPGEQRRVQPGRAAA